MLKKNFANPTPTGPVLPGLKPVRELLSQNPQQISRLYLRASFRQRDLTEILQQAKKNGIPCTETDSKTLDELCARSGVAHQGIVAILNEAHWLTLEAALASLADAPLPLLLALDQVQDTRNIGAIARSAWALGCAGLIVPRHNSADLGPGAFKTSAGALQRLPVCSVSNLARALDAADERGVHIYGATCGDNGSGTPANAFTLNWQLPAVLVLGNEEKGIRPGVLKRCHTLVTIPFARPFDSLNVAQAGTLLAGLCAARLNQKRDCS